MYDLYVWLQIDKKMKTKVKYKIGKIKLAALTFQLETDQRLFSIV